MVNTDVAMPFAGHSINALPTSSTAIDMPFSGHSIASVRCAHDNHSCTHALLRSQHCFWNSNNVPRIMGMALLRAQPWNHCLLRGNLGFACSHWDLPEYYCTEPISLGFKFHLHDTQFSLSEILHPNQHTRAAMCKYLGRWYCSVSFASAHQVF